MGISFLATSSPERAVWLSFAFYLLNLLVPIIPAVIIYRLFPEGKGTGAQAAGGSVEGSVAGWKIKAVGAWGAYVTAFVLGLWAIKSTAVPLIKAVGGGSVWTLDSDFRFTDEKGSETEAALTNLEVEPPMVLPWGKHATVTLFSATLDPPDKIRVKMQGYDPAIVPLSDVPVKDGKIKLLTPITLKQLPPIASGPAPRPLPAPAGPPAVTSQSDVQTTLAATPSPASAGSPAVTSQNDALQKTLAAIGDSIKSVSRERATDQSTLLMMSMLLLMEKTTDLRGGVVRSNPNTQIAEPLAGVGVALFEVTPKGNFNLVRQTVTGPDGSYYFSRVLGKHYILQIDGTNYPLEVREGERQDIPIITTARH
jgi:hypothetical protein